MIEDLPILSSPSAKLLCFLPLLLFEDLTISNYTIIYRIKKMFFANGIIKNQ